MAKSAHLQYEYTVPTVPGIDAVDNAWEQDSQHNPVELLPTIWIFTFSSEVLILSCDVSLLQKIGTSTCFSYIR